MKELRHLLSSVGHTHLFGAPEGIDALAVAELFGRGGGGSLIHVARDDEHMMRFAAALGFFAPALEPLYFPAWDCLPYDRVSPLGEILSRRIDVLSRLADAQPGRRILLLTTVNALLQRLPPRDGLTAVRFSGAVGGRLDMAALQNFLSRNGYGRTDTVMEPGEYAVRGGIVDVFPPGTEEPFRIDLFGDEIEGIRRFDPLTQRTTGTRESFDLRPVSEVLLDQASIHRFRSSYRELFGPVGGEDPLYEAVSAGRRYPGVEHWLPLFHERLDTLFDYLPDASVVLAHEATSARDTRFETIAEHYAARCAMTDAEAGAGTPYRPVPPERAYLDIAAWNALLADRPVVTLSPFAMPDDGAETAGGIDLGGRRVVDFSEARARPDTNLYAAVGDRLASETAAGRRVVLAAYSTGSLDRLRHLLEEQGVEPMATVADWSAAEALPLATLGLAVLDLERGFTAPGATVVTEQDVLGERLTRRPRGRRRADRFLTETADIVEGDLVVHVDHGIGRYEGLETLQVGGAPHDCLRLVYHGGDKLFVPVENIEVLSRFGSEDANVQLDRLGGVQWQARKARLKKRIREMADQLIAIAAQRFLNPGELVVPPEGLYDEFCARFPYPETEDQLRAIEDVIEDLGTGRPMDRLVCGDVGFGKTEVALRAAFLAAMAGLQVAVVVPTTLLARQHHQTFVSRFAGLPVRIGQLSRLVTSKDAKAVKDELSRGTLDIVVGTHALLAKSISFKRLGLLIVDEEQHFGVAHKERLKSLRADVHVLTLTATPIPRTLQMALSGVRELSVIATPPVDRLAVRTFVMPYDALTVREAIQRERFRGGQCFYVCPRVRDLPEVKERVEALVPDAKIALAHGSMGATELEDVMTGFYDHRYDILISTNIVESGLDIPTANTMIIHRADMFGLAQLYQLRGRIGRGKVRAYAYMTLPPQRRLTKAAEKRLHVMQTLDTLGAGFTLASYDLDIRGAGNLLGEEQSGHIREVGVELYQSMLEEAVADAKAGVIDGTAAQDSWSPQINIGTPVLIPEAYVPELSIRLALYRRTGTLEDAAAIDSFAAELVDRFGPLPEEVGNLLEIVAIKKLCREAGVEKIDAGPKGAVVAFRNDSFANPAGLVEFLTRQVGTAKLRTDHRLVYNRDWTAPKARLRGVRRLLESLVGIATRATAA